MYSTHQHFSFPICALYFSIFHSVVETINHLIWPTTFIVLIGCRVLPKLIFVRHCIDNGRLETVRRRGGRRKKKKHTANNKMLTAMLCAELMRSLPLLIWRPDTEQWHCCRYWWRFYVVKSFTKTLKLMQRILMESRSWFDDRLHQSCNTAMFFHFTALHWVNVHVDTYCTSDTDAGGHQCF